LEAKRVESGVSLAEHRIHAAEVSGGTSSDEIYACVERVINRRNLQGCVLDYGAGAGNLTKRLAALGRFKQVSGADIMPRPDGLPGNINWVQADLNNQLTIPQSAYDVVVCAEVIEHLENPREAARQLHGLLKPGGTLILTTPNNESFRSFICLIFRGHFMAFTDSCYPAHITALLRKDISRIFREVGFSEPEFGFTDLGGVPGHPTLSWQRLSFGLLNGLRFSDNLIATTVKR
jgi:2-polyprenyl-3-methyl-5-hydroxy-6-metoxy-1,4-benzoquinol methylase